MPCNLHLNKTNAGFNQESVWDEVLHSYYTSVTEKKEEKKKLLDKINGQQFEKQLIQE